MFQRVYSFNITCQYDGNIIPVVQLLTSEPLDMLKLLTSDQFSTM
jgi:hypothetical protein